MCIAMWVTVLTTWQHNNLSCYTCISAYTEQPETIHIAGTVVFTIVDRVTDVSDKISADQ